MNGLKWKTLRHWVSIAPQDTHIDPLHSKYIGLVRLTGFVGLRVYRVYLGPAVGDPLWLVLRARFVDRAAVAASAAIVSSMALPCATISVVFGDALRLLQTQHELTERSQQVGWDGMGWSWSDLPPRRRQDTRKVEQLRAALFKEQAEARFTCRSFAVGQASASCQRKQLEELVEASVTFAIGLHTHSFVAVPALVSGFNSVAGATTRPGTGLRARGISHFGQRHFVRLETVDSMKFLSKLFRLKAEDCFGSKVWV